ncbi:transposase [uncultured Chryseobacterium sp.]|uniref:transposase n=1 Tax=uncultured Chryseobacterium sp. TaxID=259322 RepID=UPI0025D875E9|nr:transposase [uncultured Chryseobacterium sp.]
MKFSFFFDGILPSAVEIFTGQKYSTEDNAIAEAILKQVKKEEYHNNIYTTDRGLQSTRTIKEFEEKNIQFIVRSRENRNLKRLNLFSKQKAL